MGGDWDDDPTPTRIDLNPLGEQDTETPVDVEACRLCGAVCVIDDFDRQSLEAFPSHCIRAQDGGWWFCSKFKEVKPRT